MRAAARLFLIVLFAFCSRSSCQQQINIGGLFPLHQDWGIECETFARIAVENINEDPTMLPNKQLNLISFNSMGDAAIATKKTQQLMLQSDVLGIIGPGYSAEAAIVSPIIKDGAIPLVSYGATDPTLTEGDSDSLFMRSVPSDKAAAIAIYQLVTLLQWKRVLTVVSADNFGRNGLRDFNTLAQAQGLTLSTIELPLGAANYSFEASLAKDRRATILVCNIRTEMVIQWLSAARDAGLLADGYGWIVTESTMQVLSSWTHTPPVDLTLLKATSGIIGFSVQQGLSAIQQSLLSKWRTLDPVAYPGISRNSISVWSLYAYDSVLMLANGLDTISKKNISLSPPPPYDLSSSTRRIFPTGRAIRESIKSTTTTGSTGDITINTNGERDVDLNIQNWNGTAIVLVGEYAKKWPAKLLFLADRTLWPGGSRATPSGLTKAPALLKFYTKPVEGFVIINREPSVANRYSGFCIDFLDKLSSDLGFSYTLTEYNGSWVNMIKATAAGVDGMDGIATVVTGTVATSKLVYLTQPFITDGHLLLVRAESSGGSIDIWQFLNPFNRSLWGAIVILVMLGALALALMEVPHTHDHSFNPDENETRGIFIERPNYRRLIYCFGEAIWWTSGAFLGMGEAAVVTAPARLFSLFWCFAAVITNASYTANLASFLLQQRLSTTSISFEDLVINGRAIGVMCGGQSEIILRAQKANTVCYDTIPAAMDDLIARQISAVFMSQSLTTIFKKKYCETLTIGKGESKNEFGLQDIGFAFKQSIDPDLRLLFDTKIIEYWDNGFFEELQQKWIAQAQSSCTSTETTADSPQLYFEHLRGMFTIVFIGGCLSLILLMILYPKRCLSQYHYLRFVLRDLRRGRDKQPPTPPPLQPTNASGAEYERNLLAATSGNNSNFSPPPSAPYTFNPERTTTQKNFETFEIGFKPLLPGAHPTQNNLRKRNESENGTASGSSRSTEIPLAHTDEAFAMDVNVSGALWDEDFPPSHPQINIC